jgi:hypothetical protein
MTVMQALADIDALPWQTDWYRTKVREAGLLLKLPPRPPANTRLVHHDDL